MEDRRKEQTRWKTDRTDARERRIDDREMVINWLRQVDCIKHGQAEIDNAGELRQRIERLI